MDENASPVNDQVTVGKTRPDDNLPKGPEALFGLPEEPVFEQKPLVCSTRRQALFMAVCCWLLVLLLGFLWPVWHFSKTKGTFWEALGTFRTDLTGSPISKILADQAENLKQLGALLLVATMASVFLFLFRAMARHRDDGTVIRLVILLIFLLLALIMIPVW